MNDVTFPRDRLSDERLAVLTDATLVRAVLVPAAQQLLGRTAWYAPRPLRRLHTHTGLAEVHS